MLLKNSYALSYTEIFEKLGTTKNGLNEEQVKQRIEKYGLNKITVKKKITPLKIFFNQFTNFLVLLLIIASVVSFLIGEVSDSIVIGVILILNAVLGFFQEYKAEKAIDALKELASPKAIVIRDGIRREVSSEEITIGDIVVLEEGNIVPADLRIIKSNNLKVDESILTGESTSVKKISKKISKENVGIANQKNMCFSGTIITYGNGLGVVVKIGNETQVGKISKLISEAKPKKTILQQSLDKFSKSVGIIVVFLSIVLFIVGDLINHNWIEMFIMSISLAVSAIPEGLPAVITLTLAIGVQRMSKRNAIVRRLYSVETLGSVNIICTDKTGTLTKNEMSVKKIWTNNKTYFVEGVGYTPEGDFIFNEEKIDVLKEVNLKKTLEIGYFCNNSSLVKEEDKWKIIGDPTEGALVVSARKAGFTEDDIKKHKMIFEIPFDSERKRMTKIYSIGGKKTAFIKGAPDVILELSNKILIDGKEKKITRKQKEEIKKIINNFAGDALRILGMGYKKIPKNMHKFSSENVEKEIVFVGMQGMIDPPRKEVKESLKICKEAGIRVIMITGDYKLTAEAIAEEVGIESEGSLTGEDLDNMNANELKKALENVNIFARVNPEHKVKILQALRSKNKNIIAMTGDGINDAPAIENADIGIAMNIKGTDVAKSASDMILVDDNFSTIVSAIEEGRHIFSNIKKFIIFLLTSNFDEIFLVLTAFLLRIPIPFIPIQILWLNLVTDGLPALALGVEREEKEIMKRQPRDPRKNLLKSIIKFALIAGLIDFFATFFVYYYYGLKFSINKARTIVFTESMLLELFFAFSIRKERQSMFRTNPFENLQMFAAVMLSLVLQLFVIYVPFMQPIFKTVGLSGIDWLVIFFFDFIAITIIDMLKPLLLKD